MSEINTVNFEIKEDGDHLGVKIVQMKEQGKSIWKVYAQFFNDWVKSMRLAMDYPSWLNGKLFGGGDDYMESWAEQDSISSYPSETLCMIWSLPKRHILSVAKVRHHSDDKFYIARGYREAFKKAMICFEGSGYKNLRTIGWQKLNGIIKCDETFLQLHQDMCKIAKEMDIPMVDMASLDFLLDLIDVKPEDLASAAREMAQEYENYPLLFDVSRWTENAEELPPPEVQAQYPQMKMRSPRAHHHAMIKYMVENKMKDPSLSDMIETAEKVGKRVEVKLVNEDTDLREILVSEKQLLHSFVEGFSEHLENEKKGRPHLLDADHYMITGGDLGEVFVVLQEIREMVVDGDTGYMAIWGRIDQLRSLINNSTTALADIPDTRTHMISTSHLEGLLDRLRHIKELLMSDRNIKSRKIQVNIDRLFTYIKKGTVKLGREEYMALIKEVVYSNIGE